MNPAHTANTSETPTWTAPELRAHPARDAEGELGPGADLFDSEIAS